MKRILFNATHTEELRLAIVDGQRLLDLDIESTAYQQKKGNVYKGKVTRVEPSLEAAFVDYGMERQGFLPLKEISRVYFMDMDPGTPISQIRIKDVIKEGQELIVQVEKEERGTKGAALTTFISLAGRYLVLMPNNPKGGGISRRIEGEERAELRQAMAELDMPEDCAIIARTAGLGRGVEELQWDLDYLVHLWRAIAAAAEQPAPFLVYQEGNLVVRTIRDYLRSEIGEIIIDSPEVHERMQKFMEQVTPHNLNKLKLYNDETPLFSRFQIEHQIESAFSREVQLSSGGSVVFDRTEALISIDVNSARATKGADIEETALTTNLEAAEEIALQLRLRDLGGLIVIDFIDMTPTRNQRAVEQCLNEALKLDRARVQVGRISRFGLLEMSRQRLRPSLGEASSLVCPRCGGTGHIRGVLSSALHILRVIQDEAMKENTAALHIHLPVSTATYLLNEKRHELNTIESRLATPIYIIPAADMDTPHYRIRRLRSEDVESGDEQPLSYQIERQEEAEETPEVAPGITKAAKGEKPAVGQLVPMGKAPPRKRVSREGLFVRLFRALFGTAKKKPKPARDRGAQRGRRGGQRRPQARGRSQQRQQRRAPQSKTKKAEPRQQAKQEKTDNKEKKERKEGQQRSSRGRRGRGGRRPSQKSASQTDDVKSTDASSADTRKSGGGKKAPATSQEPPTKVPDERNERKAENQRAVSSADTPVKPAKPETHSTPGEAPDERRGAASRPQAEEKVTATKAETPDSGLIQIETKTPPPPGQQSD